MNEKTSNFDESRPAVAVPVQGAVGRLEPERTCAQGCNGCDECTEYDDYDDLLECPRCHGDGMDPWVDYMMPCPACQWEQRP